MSEVPLYGWLSTEVYVPADSLPRKHLARCHVGREREREKEIQRERQREREREIDRVDWHRKYS